MVSREVFVNPYTFASLPTVVRRREPPGHDCRQFLPPGAKTPETRYSGAFAVRWTLLTPLVLPPETRAPAPRTRPVELAGSSVKGAVRSLHETLFGGCLRVVDPDFVPSYRAPATGKTAEWTLAQVVETTSGGVPTQVRLTGNVDWVDGPDLARAYQRAGQRMVPTTGDVFAVDRLPEETTLGRWEIQSVGRLLRRAHPRRPEPTTMDPVERFGLAEPSPTGARVLLVTDVRVRRPVRKNGTRGRALWASGVLTDSYLPIEPAVAQAFGQACAGADDLRRLQSGHRSSDPKRFAGAQAPIDSGDDRQGDWRRDSVPEDVRWWADYDGPSNGPKVVIGRRHLTTGLVFPGDVVWVRLSGDDTSVLQIDLAEIWRNTGIGRVAERVPAATLPCRYPRAGDRPAHETSPIGLCLSCEIFGSVADPAVAEKGAKSGPDSRGGSQASYAGHVRFGTARAIDAVEVEQVELAPTGTPHLGVGMFSLTPPRTLDPRRPRNELPGRWGSSPDVADPRQLRGRKFYWHSDPQAQADHWSAVLARPVTPRHLRRPHQSADQGRKASLVPALHAVPGTDGPPQPTVLEQTITVDGITEGALQTLLAAVQPQLLLGVRKPGTTFATHLGGGKPLGLGSVRAEIDFRNATVAPMADRYGSARGAGENPDQRGGFTFRPPGVLPWLDARAANQLLQVLDVSGLGDAVHHVSYPTTAGWDAVGTKRFDESFEWFQQNNGQALARGDRPWVPLPEAGAADQTMPIDPGRSEGRR